MDGGGGGLGGGGGNGGDGDGTGGGEQSVLLGAVHGAGGGDGRGGGGEYAPHGLLEFAMPCGSVAGQYSSAQAEALALGNVFWRTAQTSWVSSRISVTQFDCLPWHTCKNYGLLTNAHLQSIGSPSITLSKATPLE